MGGWRRGLRHGQGRITYAPRAGSADFEGEWVDDVPQLPARDAAAEEAAALAALEAREAAERERAAREEEAEAARRAEDAEAAASWEREQVREEQERQQAREAQEGAAARAAEAEAAKAADEAAAAAAAAAAKVEAAAAAAAAAGLGATVHKKQDEDGHLSGSDTARHPAAPAPAPAPPLEPAPPSAPRPITHAATVRGGGGNGSKAGRSGVPQLGLEVLDAGDGARGASDARRGGAGDGGGRESLAGRRPLSARGVNILPETSQLFPLPADAPEALCAPGASRPGSARRAGRGDKAAGAAATPEQLAGLLRGRGASGTNLLAALADAPPPPPAAARSTARTIRAAPPDDTGRSEAGPLRLGGPLRTPAAPPAAQEGAAQEGAAQEGAAQEGAATLQRPPSRGGGGGGGGGGGARPPSRGGGRRVGQCGAGAAPRGDEVDDEALRLAAELNVRA